MSIKVANGWTDFEVIATGGGEKLERWGGIYLLRPDPQAIWSPRSDFSKYDGLHAHYLRSNTGGGKWKILKKFPEEWTVKYTFKSGKQLKFYISPTGFKHTGLFPEQAVNWEQVSCLIADVSQAHSPQRNNKSSKASINKSEDLGDEISAKVSVLNLFGYTGGATVAAASSGAQVTHVDASTGMTDVCRRNCELNGINSVRYIVDDCAKFVAREIRRGKKYDAIIMDPPSFGRGANGEVWKIEQHLEDLVKICVQVLSEKPLFFLINSYTTGLQPTVLKNILARAFEKLKLDASIDAYEIGLSTCEKIVLPAGCSCLATFKEV